jgi:hypothetical protein
MRRFDAESTVLQGIRDECEIISERAGHGLVAIAARHPTLGKLVTVSPADEAGVMVEAKA